MSGLLAAIGLGFIGLVIGAAIQRWGDADRATHGHQDYDWRAAFDRRHGYTSADFQPKHYDVNAPQEWFV